MRLAPQAWIEAPATQAVMRALEAAGGVGCARFVGGAVRNSLMDAEVDDVDIATTLEPQGVIDALRAAGLKSLPTGVDHGTVTALSGGAPYEITTLRRDVSTDGRNATVAYTDDWAQDAMRRDFRLNALYADARGEVFDPTGEGIADAKGGRIVFVGEAATRIREDYLRVLRFFRFWAWYGRGQPDVAALAACAAAAGELDRLSAERVQKEFLKLLAAPAPLPALMLMAQAGVLAALVPEATDLARFEMMVGIDGDPILRLAALLPDDADVGRKVAGRLRLSNAARDRLAAGLAAVSQVSATMTDATARRVLYAIGWQAFSDGLKLLWARTPPSPASLLIRMEGWEKPVVPLGGRDVLAAGVAPGPAVTTVLREVEAWWIAHDFPQDRDAALAQMRAAVAKL